MAYSELAFNICSTKDTYTALKKVSGHFQIHCKFIEMENCLHISKKICMRTFVCVFISLFLKTLLSFNVLILEKLLPYHCVKKRYERIFVKIISLGGRGCKGVAAPQAGQNSVSLWQIIWKNNRQFGQKFTERLQPPPPKFCILLRPWSK